MIEREAFSCIAANKPGLAGLIFRVTRKSVRYDSVISMYTLRHILGDVRQPIFGHYDIAGPEVFSGLLSKLTTISVVENAVLVF